MILKERIAAFAELGNRLRAIDKADKEALFQNARNENAWFTEESVSLALNAWCEALTEVDLERWASSYDLSRETKKTVAIVMAGNIPLVGFHDLLSVLISGHAAQIKLSSKDTVLLTELLRILESISPDLRNKIQIVEQLKGFEAVIATGSDNTARYFEYYFGKYPHIIRKNRTSCAVVNGKETPEDLVALGRDVFSYFGLGCRNVSKVFIPKSYDPITLFEGWKSFHQIIHHHKYHNNYDYQKSILLVNQSPFLDNGFVMLEESARLVSPISVVFYERYEDEGDLALKLFEKKEKIQCIVGSATSDSVPFGHAQVPKLWDYADNMDTLKFLSKLGRQSD